MTSVPQPLAIRGSANSTSTLYSYSPNHAFLAISRTVAASSRITLYQLDSKSVLHEHIPPNRTFVTSLAWDCQKNTVLAIGLSNGSIQLLDVLEGQARSPLEHLHTAAITHCLFHPDAPILFTCSAEGWIMAWDVEKGSMKTKFKTTTGASPTRIALSPDATYLAVADTSVTLFTNPLSDPKELYTFASHAADVQTLWMTASPHWVYSSAVEDRFIQLHHCTQESATILPSLSLPSSVTHLSVSAQGHVACVAKDGKVYLWSSMHTTPSAPKKKKKRFATKEPEVILNMQEETTKTEHRITSCMFNKENQLTITWGKGIDPKFECLEILDENGALLPSRTLYRTENVAATLTMEAAAQKPGPAQHVVDVGRLPKTHPHSMAFQSFADQLNALPSLYEVQPETDTAAAAAAPQAPHAQVHAAHLNLTQALKSNDAALLESILMPTTLPKDLHGTVAQLPCKWVVPLLYQLLDRLTTKPARAPVLLGWIHATLVAHSAYLLTLPDLPQTLAPLYHHFESRAQHAHTYQKLMGRIDFVLAKREGPQAAPKSLPPTLLTHVHDEDATYEDLSYPTAGTTLRHVFPKASKKTWEKLANDGVLAESPSDEDVDEKMNPDESEDDEDEMDVSDDDSEDDDDEEKEEGQFDDDDDDDDDNEEDSSGSETKVNGASDSDMEQDEDHE